MAVMASAGATTSPGSCAGSETGALVVAGDADEGPDDLARVRSSGGDDLSVPFGEDIELSMRL